MLKDIKHWPERKRKQFALMLAIVITAIILIVCISVNKLVYSPAETGISKPIIDGKKVEEIKDGFTKIFQN